MLTTAAAVVEVVSFSPFSAVFSSTRFSADLAFVGEAGISLSTYNRNKNNSAEQTRKFSGQGTKAEVREGAR